MNLLRRIIGTSTTDEVSSIHSGKLFLTRSPNSPKGAYECLYNDAYALIRRTTTANYYQLCITRVFEEGEDIQNSAFDDSDDEDGSESQTSSRDINTNKDEWKFAITEELKICRHAKPDGSIGISWQDLNGDLGDEFEFVIDQQIKQAQIDSFVLALYRCLYEQKYQETSIGVPENELIKEFAIDPKKRHQTLPFDDLQKSFDLLPTEPEVEYESDDFQDVTPSGEILYHNTDFSLFLFDSKSGDFKIQLESSKVDVKIFDLGNWEYTLYISEIDSNKYIPIYINASISQNMNPTFNYVLLSFIFNDFIVNNSIELSAHSWLLKSSNFEELQKFQTSFMKAMWETSHQKKYTVQKTDEEYMAETLRNVKLSDDALEDIGKDEDEDEDEDKELEDEEDINKIIQNRMRGKITESDDEFGDNDKEIEENYFQQTVDENSGISVGYANDRAFVVRGDKIGVFETESGLDFKTSINNLKDLQGKKFTPKTTLLHQQDQFMIMSNKEHNDKSLYKMDLNRGEIIEEWEIDKDIPIVSYAPNTKYSQLTDEQTLTGIQKNGLFKIDPRLSGNKHVNDVTYKTNAKLLSLATTDKGYIAVGADTGDIRLYDRLGVRAKTVLPSLGDPVIGIDVSSDGRWVLATYKTYLLLIDVKIGGENKNAGSLGFNNFFDKDKKPTPIRLSVRPEHAGYITKRTGKGLSFTTAHFNTGVSTKESVLVTSCGPYIISWSLKQILLGKTDSYIVKEYQGPVVADNFKFGSKSDVIFALPNDVSMVQRKRLTSGKTLLRETRDSVIDTYK